MALTIDERTAEKIAGVNARAAGLRDEIADALALARGPTSADDMRDRIQTQHVTTCEIDFQLSRMADEGRAVEQGRDRYTLANR